MLIAGLAALLGLGRVAFQYAQTDLAWRAFPRGGALVPSTESKLLNPLYEIDISNNPNLRDGDLSVFTSLPTITRLNASNTPLTDKCLHDLKTLSGLRSVDISGTKISERGAMELRECLPECTIQY